MFRRGDILVYLSVYFRAVIVFRHGDIPIYLSVFFKSIIVFRHGDIPFPRARQEFGTSIAPCRSDVLAAVQQRRVNGHFTRRTLTFRFKSMGEEKWTAG